MAITNCQSLEVPIGKPFIYAVTGVIWLVTYFAESDIESISSSFRFQILASISTTKNH